MKTRTESGYIALLAVLVVGAAAAAIGVTLLTTGIDSQRSGIIEQQSKQARSLAVACAEEAMQQIHDNTAFAGSNNLTMGQGNCTYFVTVTSSTASTVTTSGTVGNVVKKIRVYVTIGTSSISITSWQEIS